MGYKPHDAAPLPYTVQRIDFQTCREFVCAHHYAHGMANAATASFGLFDGSHMIGALAFATPCSENVRKSIYGADHVQRITELHRLVILDVTPPNAESFMIARALGALKEDKPHLWGVVSFADGSMGHTGTIYQATNSKYYGLSYPHRHYVDQDGRRRSPRQCKITVSVAEARARGWTVARATSKFRYLFTLPDDRRHGRALADLLKRNEKEDFDQGYPKKPVTMNSQMALF